MRIAIHECKHCREEYQYQWSGSRYGDEPEIPKEYRDEDYCPSCKKSIHEALLQIPVKYEYQYVDTDEVTLDTLLAWEQQTNEEQSKEMLPRAMRVFASLMDRDSGEIKMTREVIGRDDKKGRIYIYSYYPSKKEECSIRVERRVNLLTTEVGKYKIRN